MRESLASELANHPSKACVVAPAGYGKTHLIASSVQSSKQRQLILTHTYAGVDAIRKKLIANKVLPSKYHVDTIASWSLRVCLSYPKSSGWSKELPDSNDWKDLYFAAAELLRTSFFQHVVTCSYSGVFVDEYQDCSIGQHRLIYALSEILPCRIFGDPMQGIFDFNGGLVDWDTDVYPAFPLFTTMDTPWRWNLTGAFELSEWLQSARLSLQANSSIQVSGNLPKGVSVRPEDPFDFNNKGSLKVFYDHVHFTDSVAAILSGAPLSKSKTHSLSKRLAGKFSSIEEIEGKDLHKWIRKLETATNSCARILILIDFLKACCNSVAKVLPKATKEGRPGTVTKATKHPELIYAANNFLKSGFITDLYKFFQTVSITSGITVYRRDLMNRMRGVLRLKCENQSLSFTAAALQYQREFRFAGRPIKHNKIIATTLLVKGLEFGHSIVIDPESMTQKDLYVALTRGSKSLTIMTSRQEIGGVPK